MLAKIGKSYPSPAWAHRALRIRNSYDAATTGRRSLGWRAPTVGPNDAVLPNLSTLRARSRAGVRNDGFARTAIDRLVSNIIGTGILPQSQAPDPEFRDRVEQLWLDWTDESDASGTLDLYGQQAQAVRGWLEGGEVFVRLRSRLPSDGLSVPLQLEIIEPELCPLDHTTTAGANRVRAGIEFSPIGRRVAYFFYRRHPGDSHDLGTGDLVRVPADTVVHLYDPIRAGQIRGVPQLTQALLRLYELDKYDDATLVRQQIQNLFAVFLTRTGPAGDPELNPVTGQPIERGDNEEALMPLEPGAMLDLEAGVKPEFSNPPDATGYADFMRAQLMGAAVSAEVPFEVLTGDMRNINDRTVRVILNEFRRRIEQRQHFIVGFQLMLPVWRAWFDAAVVSGALEVPAGFLADPTPWMRVEWVPSTWPYLHPVQDVMSEKAMVRAGFKSNTQVIKERGGKLETVYRELAAEQKLARDLGLTLDSDPSQTANSGIAQDGDDPAPSREGA